MLCAPAVRYRFMERGREMFPAIEKFWGTSEKAKENAMSGPSGKVCTRKEKNPLLFYLLKWYNNRKWMNHHPNAARQIMNPGAAFFGIIQVHAG